MILRIHLGMVLVAVLVSSVSGETILDEDFTDGSSADWSTSFAGVTITDGSMVLSGRGLAYSGPVDAGFQDISNISVRTQVRLLDGVAVGIGVRVDGGNYNGGVFALDPSNELSQMGYIDRADPFHEFGTAAVDFDVAEEDVFLQMDAIGNQIELWAWPAGSPMPSEPLMSISDDVHESGSFFLFAISEDYDRGNQLPASAAFRSVTVATTPIPEPSTFVLSALGLLGLLACRRMSG